MTITINGTTGITNDGGYTGDGVVFADTTPANTLVTTTGGNVGIGTSSPGNKLVTASSATNSKIEIQNTSTAASTSKTSALQFTGADTVGTLKETGDIYVTPADNNYVGSNMLFYTRGSDAVSERARIDSSGNLLFDSSQAGTTIYVNKSSNSTLGGLEVGGSTNYGRINFQNVSGVGQYACAFYYGSSRTFVGNILTNATSTTYATSSDYRLKHDIQPMTGALAKVALLKPCTYKWKVDGSEGQGFIAHELAEVEPGCVTGEKDAVDAEGNPVYQGIDTSFLTATLTAAIQEQQAIILAQEAALTALTARVAALEGK